jgi:hypothetical protein
MLIYIKNKAPVGIRLQGAFKIFQEQENNIS